MGRPLTLVAPGDRYNYLVIVAEIESQPRAWSTSSYRRMHVRCDCGNETIVRLDNLRIGQTKSCGCGIARRKAG